MLDSTLTMQKKSFLETLAIRNNLLTLPTIGVEQK
jgi:hypothetical protein